MAFNNQTVLSIKRRAQAETNLEQRIQGIPNCSALFNGVEPKNELLKRFLTASKEKQFVAAFYILSQYPIPTLSPISSACFKAGV